MTKFETKCGDFLIFNVRIEDKQVKCSTKCCVCGRINNKISYYSVLKRKDNTHGNICSKEAVKELKLKTNENSKESQFYRIWCNMKTRCNPNYAKAHRYFERGIDCEEFTFFVDFYDSMYNEYCKHIEKYGEENTTLERVDNDKSYSKKNCCFATWEQQAKNRGNLLDFIAISPSGEKFQGVNLKQFCEQHNISYDNAIAGLHQGNITWKNGWKFYRI